MAHKFTPKEIIARLLGPAVVVNGAEILGPNESRLHDALEAKIADGLADFSIAWGEQALRMPREMLAGTALEILLQGRRHARPAQFARRVRPTIDLREFVAGF